MFYRVKVMDGAGKLKKVISSKRLSNRFWRQHEQKQLNPLDIEDYDLDGGGDANDGVRNSRMKLPNLEE